MRVFVTGASGWIGSAAVDELLAAVTRSPGWPGPTPPPTALAGQGRPGPSRRPRRPRRASGPAPRIADAVIHLANKHDFVQPGRLERGRAGRGPDHRRRTRRQRPSLPARLGRRRPHPGQARQRGRRCRRSTARSRPRGGARTSRSSSSTAACATVSLRFAPTVHGTGDHGFIAAIAGDRPPAGRLRLSRRRNQPVGGSASLRRRAADRPRAGEGGLDYRAADPACTRSPRRASRPGRSRRRSVARSTCPSRRSSPDDVQDHFGWIGTFFGMEMSATSTLTRELLGWTPTGPTLIEDLDAGAYAVRTPVSR